MEFSQLRYFAAVAEAGSMLRAASRLRVSQPAVSRQIRNLEASLGRRLFVRNDRGVQLTPAGADYYEGVRRLLDEFDALNARMRADDGAAELHLGLVQIAQDFPIVTQALDAFRRRYPQVRLEGLQMLSRNLIDAVRAGDIDVAIGAAMLGVPADFQAMKLFELKRGAVMARSHPLAGHNLLRFEDLAPFPLVGYTRSTWPESMDAFFELCRSRGFEPRFSQTFDNNGLLMTRVRDGESIALLPEPGPDAHAGNLVFRPIAGLDARFSISMLWRSETDKPWIDRFVREMRAVVEGPV
jgi:DNA-binding transcriptional LysR family regulator